LFISSARLALNGFFVRRETLLDGAHGGPMTF